MSIKIYTTHEKPDLAEPSARTVLVREGFSYAAAVFSIFWLLARKLWLVAIGYVVVLMVVAGVTSQVGLEEYQTILLQLTLTILLGANAYDLERWTLTRRGYRMTGVVVAESSLAAERRYHDSFA